MAASTVIDSAIVLKLSPEVLGVESEYEKRRIALKEEYDPIITAASKVTTVASNEEMENATRLGQVLQAGLKEIEAFFKPIKSQIDDLKKPVLTAEKDMAGKITAVKATLGIAISNYIHEQERIRKEQERIAQEKADADAREAALNRAVDLDLAGEHKMAEEVLNEPISAPVAVQRQVPIRTSGQVNKTRYSVTVTDLRLLVKAVYEGKVPLQCIMADESYLNSKARLEKKSFNVPGVRLNEEEATHFRA